MIRLLVVAGLWAGLAGCATTPSGDAAKMVPAERVYPYPTGPAQVVVTRDGGMLGSACKLAVLYKGQPVAHLWAGERVVLMLPEGEALLGVGQFPAGVGLCLNGFHSIEEKLVLAAGKMLRYRIAIDGTIRFAPSSF